MTKKVTPPKGGTTSTNRGKNSGSTKPPKPNPAGPTGRPR